MGPDHPKFRLLDPATGATEIVAGVFEPFFDQSMRPLQPTGIPDEAWATRFDEKSGATQVGRYDMRNFRFDPVMSAPMRFSSMQMWVDEAEGKLYVAYNAHLLRMTLPENERQSNALACTSNVSRQYRFHGRGTAVANSGRRANRIKEAYR